MLLKAEKKKEENLVGKGNLFNKTDRSTSDNKFEPAKKEFVRKMSKEFESSLLKLKERRKLK